MALVSVGSSTPILLSTSGTTNDRLTVKFLDVNRSTGTLYYGSAATVSPTSNNGSLTPGQSITLDRQSLYFIAAPLADGSPASGQVASFVPTETQLVGDLFRLNPTNGNPQFSSDHGTTWSDLVGAGANTTGTIFQGINGYVPDGTGIPNQGVNIQTEMSTGGLYSDNAVNNLFHFASYVFNDGTRPTVAVFGFGKGAHVWGSNFVAYGGETSAPSGVIGCEIDFGNLNVSSAPTSLVGLDLVSIGGNVGGVFPPASGSFIQVTSNNPLSQIPFGLRFNAGTFQPIGTLTGTKISGTLASGSNQLTNANPTTGYNNGDFITASGIPSGTTITSGAGTSTLTLSNPATSTGNIGTGGAFIFTSGTGTLIAATGSNVSLGIDFSGATFSAAAIQFGPNGNVKFDSTTGSKLGTSTGQKIGFWNATPVAKQSVAGSRSGGTALTNLLTTLALVGLITDSTTA